MLVKKSAICHSSTSVGSSKKDEQSIAFSAEQSNHVRLGKAGGLTRKDAMLTWMKDVGHRAVVHDNGLGDISIQQRQVFHVVPWKNGNEERETNCEV